MNLSGHRFSQNTNKKISKFLSYPLRTKIWKIFGWDFGTNDDLINSFWIQLTFNICHTKTIHQKTSFYISLQKNLWYHIFVIIWELGNEIIFSWTKEKGNYVTNRLEFSLVMKWKSILSPFSWSGQCFATTNGRWGFPWIFISKVNTVQEACAKCFAVHLLKFEILQTTWKNKTKNIKMLNLLVKNWKLRVWCSLFHFFSCDLQDFKF